jgi:hypothetical protein
MAWLRRKNAEYAPAIRPVTFALMIASFGLNRPEFGTIFGTVFVASLTTGKE